MAELTERQQQIKALVDTGLDATAIAKELGISRNAVYKHLERIERRQNGGKPAPESKTAKTAKKGLSARHLRKPGTTPNGDPLEVVRARRRVIEDELSARKVDLDTARNNAQNSLEQLGPELSALIEAEKVLGGNNDVGDTNLASELDDQVRHVGELTATAS